MNRALIDYTPETEAFEREALSADTGEAAGVLGEIDEMEMATGLLDLGGESELDHFLVRLISNAGRAIGQSLPPPTARALAGMLKGAAKQALPKIAEAQGAFVGGAAAGETLGRPTETVGHYFGLELEGLSAEDQEFEVARRFVRFASDAVQHTAAAAGHQISPQAAGRKGLFQAAKHHAPGLLSTLVRRRVTVRDAPLASPPAGRWMRRGRHLIIFNC